MRRLWKAAVAAAAAYGDDGPSTAADLREAAGLSSDERTFAEQLLKLTVNKELRDTYMDTRQQVMLNEAQLDQFTAAQEREAEILAESQRAEGERRRLQRALQEQEKKERSRQAQKARLREQKRQELEAARCQVAKEEAERKRLQQEARQKRLVEEARVREEEAHRQLAEQRKRANEEEAQRQLRQEAMLMRRELHARLERARMERERVEQLRLQEAARREAERLEAARLEAERLAAVRAAQEKAMEEMRRWEEARLAAERMAREEVQRLQREQEAARLEAERIAREAERLERERAEQWEQYSQLHNRYLRDNSARGAVLDTHDWNVNPELSRWTNYEYRFDQIPWPVHDLPTPERPLTHAAVAAYILDPIRPCVECQGVLKTIKEELLFWHPDKFRMRILPNVTEEDKAWATQTADDLARILTDLLREAPRS